MLFRIVMVVIALAACYAGYEIAKARYFYYNLGNPKAEFTVLREGNHSAPAIVEFLNYDCLYCKSTHAALLDYAQKNPDIRYVVRPVPFANGYAQEAAEMVLAAGLQEKFWEFDKAVTEYRGVPDEKFYRETAGLYGIDYDKMLRDRNGEDVQNMARDNIEATLSAGLQSTPAFMIGKTIYQLDRPLTLPDLIRMVQAEKAR